MYRLISTEPAPKPRSKWVSEMPAFETYRCSHCGALAVMRGAPPPKVCGKCHQ